MATHVLLLGKVPQDLEATPAEQVEQARMKVSRSQYPGPVSPITTR
jgi:hypothetical protein